MASRSALYRSLVGDGLAELDDVSDPVFAHDMSSAVAAMLTAEPDLIIADDDLTDSTASSVVDVLQSSTRPVPVVLLTDSERQVDRLSRGSEHGDVDVVLKPWNPNRAVTVTTLAQQLGPLVRHAAASGGSRRRGRRTSFFAIGASTGGPTALRDLVAQLPARFGAAVAIVQHMPYGFLRPLADQLDRASQLQVTVADDEDEVRPGSILIAPANKHLTVVGGHGVRARIRLTDDPPVHGCRPAVDVLARSAARTFGPQAGLVILTGIGRDGTAGARAVHAAGGRVIAQSERSSSVYGMPRAAAEAGVVDTVLNLKRISELMIRWAGVT